MKTKLRKTLVLISVVALLFSVTPLYAEGTHENCGMGEKGTEAEYGHQRGRGPKEGAMAKLIEELGLTPEQQEQLKTQREAHRGKMKELHETLKTKRAELKEELEKAGSNEGRINSLASEVKSLMSESVDLRVGNILEVKAILTPEQFEEFKKHVAMKKKKGQGRGRKGSFQGEGEARRSEDEV